MALSLLPAARHGPDHAPSCRDGRLLLRILRTGMVHRWSRPASRRL